MRQNFRLILIKHFQQNDNFGKNNVFDTKIHFIAFSKAKCNSLFPQEDLPEPRQQGTKTQAKDK